MNEWEWKTALFLISIYAILLFVFDVRKWVVDIIVGTLFFFLSL